MKYDEISAESIRKLVELFYAEIRQDKSKMGAVFVSILGTSDESWEAHQDRIENFWVGMLLGKGDYSGQPLKIHMELPPFPKALFGEWISLFKKTLDKIYTPEIAEQILSKAQMFSQRFQEVMYCE